MSFGGTLKVTRNQRNNHEDTIHTPSEEEGIAGSVDIRANTVDDRILQLAVDGEVRLSRLRIMIGCILIIAGIILILLGYLGSINWEINIPGLSSKLSNASPGIICLVAGFLIVIISIPKITISNYNDSQNR